MWVMMLSAVNKMSGIKLKAVDYDGAVFSCGEFLDCPQIYMRFPTRFSKNILNKLISQQVLTNDAGN
jgi:hypothetical protein